MKRESKVNKKELYGRFRHYIRITFILIGFFILKIGINSGTKEYKTAGCYNYQTKPLMQQEWKFVSFPDFFNFDVPNPNPKHRQGEHHADTEGVGYDRTVATGSGYTAQYHEPLASGYESLKTCPDNILLWFHHVPYTHELKSGKTVIQHIYDSHYNGTLQAKDLRDDWKILQGKIDKERYEHVLDRFNQQIEHAKMWRDTIVNYFSNLSGIPDLPDYGTIELKGLNVPAEVKANVSFTVEITVRNTGKQITGKVVNLFIDGKQKDSRTVRVMQGKMKRVSFTLRLFEPGDYEVRIGNMPATTVKIIP